jgi:membrane-bound metal-dependent hydrolase YbcI (DUF457 family)
VTPLGHAGVGVVLAHADRRLWLPALVLGAMLPDIDFALVWAPQFNAWHRVVTHNLLFVALTSVALGLLLARRTGRAPALPMLALALGGLSHLAIDACMDANASNGIGVALLWPLSPVMVSPFNLLTPQAGGPGWSDPVAAARAALPGVLWELPGIALGAVLLRRRLRHRRAGA